MDLLKNNIIKVSKLIKNKSLTKELEKGSQSNLFKKEMNKTSLDNLFKDEMMILKFKLSENERIQYNIICIFRIIHRYINIIKII